MRTRRSPRNQQILWRALTPPAPPAPEPPPKVQRCFECAHYPKGGRSHGRCALLNRTANGLTPDLACFVGRPAKMKETR